MKNKRKKWPWIVLISISGTYILLGLFIWIAYALGNAVISGFEKDIAILKKGEQYAVVQSNDYVDYILQPNKPSVKIEHDELCVSFMEPLVFSQKQTVFAKTLLDEHFCKTEIVVEEEINSSKQVISFSGNYLFAEDGEGKIMGRNLDGNEFVLMDATIGLIEKKEISSLSFEKVQSYSRKEGAVYNRGQDYFVLSDEEEIKIDFSHCDQSYLSFFDKWEMVPTKCSFWKDQTLSIIFSCGKHDDLGCIIDYDISGKSFLNFQPLFLELPFSSQIRLFRIIEQINFS